MIVKNMMKNIQFTHLDHPHSPPPRKAQPTSDPPLILAAHQKNHQDLTTLLSSGADVDVRSPATQCTALHSATAAGSLSCVMILLSHGADIRAVDLDGSTALHLASEYNRTWLLETLLKAGPEVDAKDKQGRTALHISARLGHRELVEGLLANGAKAGECDGVGRTQLHYAAGLDGDEVARCLLGSGVDVDAVDEQGDTPLHCAAGYLSESYSVDIVKLLLHHGAKAFVKNRKGRTPAFNALVRSRVGGCYHVEVFCVLLRAGGTIAGVWEDDGESCHEEKTLTMVASWGKLTAGSAYEEVMKLLITRCEKLDNRDKEGKSALHWAVHFDYVEVVRELLEKGASVNVKDEKGRTPLHAAVMGEIRDDTKKKELIVRMLLKHGADAKTKDLEGKTPLQKIPWWRSGIGIRAAFAEAQH